MANVNVKHPKYAHIKDALEELGRGKLTKIWQKEYEIRKKANFQKNDLLHLDIEKVYRVLVQQKWATPDANVKAKNKYEIEFVWTPNVRDQVFYRTRRPYED